VRLSHICNTNTVLLCYRTVYSMLTKNAWLTEIWGREEATERRQRYPRHRRRHNRRLYTERMQYRRVQMLHSTVRVWVYTEMGLKPRGGYCSGSGTQGRQKQLTDNKPCKDAACMLYAGITASIYNLSACVRASIYYRMCQKMSQLVFVRTSSNLYQIW